MKRLSLLAITLAALAAQPMDAEAQNRADAMSSNGGGRAAALAGPGFNGPLHRPGWDPEAEGGLSRRAGVSDDVANAIALRCNGRPWRIVSGNAASGRIVFRCVPPQPE